MRPGRIIKYRLGDGQAHCIKKWYLSRLDLVLGEWLRQRSGLPIIYTMMDSRVRVMIVQEVEIGYSSSSLETPRVLELILEGCLHISLQ